MTSSSAAKLQIVSLLLCTLLHKISLAADEPTTRSASTSPFPIVYAYVGEPKLSASQTEEITSAIESTGTIKDVWFAEVSGIDPTSGIYIASVYLKPTQREDHVRTGKVFRLSYLLKKMAEQTPQKDKYSNPAEDYIQIITEETVKKHCCSERFRKTVSTTEGIFHHSNSCHGFHRSRRRRKN